MRALNKAWIAAVVAVTSISGAVAGSSVEVSWPEGWRGWHHVKSMVIEDGHPLFAAFGGIHHLYANEQALEGYRAGTFPDGAVIAFDLLHEAYRDTYGNHLRLERVRLFETPNNWADCTRV